VCVEPRSGGTVLDLASVQPLGLAANGQPLGLAANGQPLGMGANGPPPPLGMGGHAVVGASPVHHHHHQHQDSTSTTTIYTLPPGQQFSQLAGADGNLLYTLPAQLPPGPLQIATLQVKTGGQLDSRTLSVSHC
jgi:hypothetical protein